MDKEKDLTLSRHGSERSGNSRKRASSKRSLSQAERDHRSRQLNPQDRLFQLSRGMDNVKNHENDWKTLMDQVAASRIQSHSDRTGRNQDFKERAQSSADKNENE
jgi:hypothetical protein